MSKIKIIILSFTLTLFLIIGVSFKNIASFNEVQNLNYQNNLATNEDNINNFLTPKIETKTTFIDETTITSNSFSFTTTITSKDSNFSFNDEDTYTPYKIEVISDNTPIWDSNSFVGDGEKTLFVDGLQSSTKYSNIGFQLIETSKGLPFDDEPIIYPSGIKDIKTLKSVISKVTMILFYIFLSVWIVVMIAVGVNFFLGRKNDEYSQPKQRKNNSGGSYGGGRSAGSFDGFNGGSIFGGGNNFGGNSSGKQKRQKKPKKPKGPHNGGGYGGYGGGGTSPAGWL